MKKLEKMARLNFKAEELSEDNKHDKAAILYKCLGKDEYAIQEALKAKKDELFEQAAKIYRLYGFEKEAKKMLKIQKGRDLAYSNLW